MLRCRKCSLFYTQERIFDLKQYDSIYANQLAYRSMIDAAQRTYAREIGYSHLWWFKRLALRWLERRHKIGHMLDVGCGPGTFLLVARWRGWKVCGVEPTKEAAEIAASFGLDIFNDTIEKFRTSGPKSFDAVTCFEVLEHVTDPVAMLRAMGESLRPDGSLLVTVPNLDDPYCLKQQIPSAIPPVHINFFNRQSISEAMQRAGLKVVKFTSLPIPSSSVRNVHGRNGFFARIPLLLVMRVFGRADGTTLVVLAKRP